ncbi:hypothetical protein [Flavobacterium davisii]|uniref:hypothetical protein n=1 Tax=Flavobacterium davisii TaxID=2906077 RepID=UPI0013FD4C58|nr:hypothetical protein [Flavobacterium davisii]
MKKILILAGLAVLTTSCTYEDVVAFLNGQTNNLTEVEKEQFNLELEKDKDGIIRPPH